MEAIKNVVLAKQANCESDRVLHYALKLTNKLNAKLTIGLCYQSEPEFHKSVAFQEANPVKEAFQFIKHEYLEDSKVNYRLVSCETGNCDEAHGTLTIYLPDLYLLDKTQVNDLYNFIDRIHCPLILLPPKVKYHPIEHITVVADLDEKERDNIPTRARNLAEVFSSTYEIMDISELSASLFNKDRQRKSPEKFIPKSDHRKYAHQLHEIGRPDMLVIMVKDKFFGVMRSFYGPSINLTQLLDFPVMIYKV